jgi:hypothetical protein
LIADVTINLCPVDKSLLLGLSANLRNIPWDIFDWDAKPRVPLSLLDS